MQKSDKILHRNKIKSNSITFKNLIVNWKLDFPPSNLLFLNSIEKKLKKIITFSTSFEKNSEILTWKDEVLRIFHWFRSPLMKKTSHNSHSYQNFYVENNHFPPPWITFINGVQIKSKCTKKPDTQRVRSCTAKSCQKRIFMKAFGKVFALSYSPKGIFVGY